MERSNSLETLFLALSDPIRLRLISLMARGEVSVSFLADETGESQPKISRHLAYLRDCGVVATRRDGKWIYYRLADLGDPSANRILGAVTAELGSRDRTYPLEHKDAAIQHSTGESRTDDDLDVFLL